MPRDRARMQKVLDHLHAHYDEPVRLAPLCDLVHLTESQLQRIFKRSARMSISAYVLQLRLGRACQMLMQTDSPVGLIATECGFSDAADFARRFRNARNMTPTAFRTAIRGQELNLCQSEVGPSTKAHRHRRLARPFRKSCNIGRNVQCDPD